MAVADVLISRVLDSLITLVSGEIEQRVKLVAGVEDEIKMLTANLRSIQAVLTDAEKRQLKQEAVKLWLQRLKLTSYDIDDVLDEWSTEILKSKIEGNHTVRSRSKVWFFIHSICFCFHEVGFRHDIAVKIKRLNGSLDYITKEKERYGFQQIQGSEQVQREMTTSVLNIPQVKGREHDKNVAMHLLLAESQENPHVISLVGMGGIGKTILAKLLYNEDSVKFIFDIRIWVCVSDPFDEMRIAKAILESLPGSPSNLVEMQNIVTNIHKRIEGKRFLLVLDDVWNEDARKWKQVEDFLKCGSPGSKILLTSRKENVVRKTGCSPEDMIRLGLLSNEECWSIFSQVVFPERLNGWHNECLEEIGRKIVKKCKGLPLAVTAIGGLLRFKDSIEEWQRVLDSELWELEEVENEVFAPLRLSFDDLSSSLKQCFLYCVIFPKDHRMSKKQLITMWAAQGYIRGTQNKDVMMMGDEQFQNLAMRSFFQDFEYDEWNGSIEVFKMHDVVHDFAQSLIVKKEYCSITVNNVEESMIDLNENKIFHVGIVLKQGASFPSSFYTLEKLRSLVVLPDFYWNSEVANISKLTCLRSLSLRKCGIEELPSDICELVHLRQLDLSWNTELKELPETICNLYNLETLDVRMCSRLESLLGEIGKLVNLMCFYNDDCPFLLLPKEISKLSGLHRLSYIGIDNDEREKLCFGDLKNLNKLGGCLEIRWRGQVRDVDVRNAEEGALKEKKNLSELFLFFRRPYEAEGNGQEMEEELIEALEAPSNLKYLKISYYKGTKCPSWISSLACLKKLDLTHWSMCEELPPLGKLPSLEYLVISGCHSVKSIGDEFLGMNKIAASTTTTTTIAFPKLTEMVFAYMSNWEEWKEDGDDGKKQRNHGERQIMPCLGSLTLNKCPKLKALPSYILHNTSLEIDERRCLRLPPTFQHLRIACQRDD